MRRRFWEGDKITHVTRGDGIISEEVNPRFNFDYSYDCRVFFSRNYGAINVDSSTLKLINPSPNRVAESRYSISDDHEDNEPSQDESNGRDNDWEYEELCSCDACRNHREERDT